MWHWKRSAAVGISQDDAQGISFLFVLLRWRGKVTVGKSHPRQRLLELPKSEGEEAPALAAVPRSAMRTPTTLAMIADPKRV